jgi:hypothetical protein
MGVGPFAYFDQGSFASLNDKIWHKTQIFFTLILQSL